MTDPVTQDPYAALRNQVQPDQADVGNSDTTNMPWGQYAEETYANSGKSLYNVGAGMVHALTPSNIPETLSGMEGAARGAVYNMFGDPVSKGPIPEGASPVQRMIARSQGYGDVDQSKINEEKNIANQISSTVPPVWTTDADRWHQFGQKFHDDPFAVTSTMAIPFGAGEGALAKLSGATAETLPTVSKIAGVGSTALKNAQLTDPATLAMKGAGLGVDALKGTASALSGVSNYDPITQLWSKGGPEGSRLRNVFNQYANGQGDYAGLLDSVNREVKGMRQDEVNAWAKDKGDLANSEVPLRGIMDTYREALDRLGPRDLATPAAQEAIDSIQGITDANGVHTPGLMDQLQSRIDLPPGHPAKTLMGVDQYKQQLWDMISASRRSNPSLANSLIPVHTDLVKQLSYVDPEYGALMKRYGDIEQKASDIAASSGSNMTAAAQYNRLLKSNQNPVGRTFIDQLSERNPEIGAALAGAGTPSDVLAHGTGRKNFEMITALPQIGASIMTGNPILAATGLGQAALSSPALTTAVAKGAGTLKRIPFAKDIGNAAPTVIGGSEVMGHNLDEAYQRMINHMQQQDQGQAAGGRIGRKSGGRTSSSAKAKADQLISMVDRIKKEQGKGTEPLLNVDDTTIAKALEIANRGI